MAQSPAHSHPTAMHRCSGQAAFERHRRTEAVVAATLQSAARPRLAVLVRAFRNLGYANGAKI